MIPGPTCDNCGHDLTEHNTACAACDRCDECMPGTCWECRELRRQNAADTAWRMAREAS
jgi:hypothetical protein